MLRSSFGLQQQFDDQKFIVDQMKGKDYMDYPEGIQCGILLHRKIENFTDSQVLFKNNVSLFFFNKLITVGSLSIRF